MSVQSVQLTKAARTFAEVKILREFNFCETFVLYYSFPVLETNSQIILGRG